MVDKGGDGAPPELVGGGEGESARPKKEKLHLISDSDDGDVVGANKAGRDGDGSTRKEM